MKTSLSQRKPPSPVVPEPVAVILDQLPIGFPLLHFQLSQRQGQQTWVFGAGFGSGIVDCAAIGGRKLPGATWHGTRYRWTRYNCRTLSLSLAARSCQPRVPQGRSVASSTFSARTMDKRASRCCGPTAQTGERNRRRRTHRWAFRQLSQHVR